MPAVPAVAEGAGQLEDLDEPPEPRVRGGSGRAGLMKPLVVLALPGMYLFYKYSQYRREQRELSRRRVTERELQHLHHKIVSTRSKHKKFRRLKSQSLLRLSRDVICFALVPHLALYRGRCLGQLSWFIPPVVTFQEI